MQFLIHWLAAEKAILPRLASARSVTCCCGSSGGNAGFEKWETRTKLFRETYRRNEGSMKLLLTMRLAD